MRVRIVPALSGLALIGSTACLFSLGEVVAPSPGGEASDAGSPEGGGIPDDGTWCTTHAPQALFCQDFDEGPPSGWSFFTTDSETQIGGVTSDSFVSPPRAARFGIKALPESGSVAAAAGFESAQVATEVHLSFDMKWESFAAGHAGVLLYLGVVETNNSLRTDVASSDGMVVTTRVADEDDSRGFERAWTTSPSVGPWARVFVDLTLGSKPHVTVRLGDPGDPKPRTVVLDADLDAAWQPGRPGFSLGMSYPKSDGDRILVDNVVFDAQ